MNSFRVVTCKLCNKSFETSCPGVICYCGDTCRMQAKRRSEKLYTKHHCKTCGVIIGRRVKGSTVPVKELCKVCIEKPKEVKQEKTYKCKNCNSKFTSITPKEFCGYTCKSQVEKIAGVTWVTQACITCSRVEKMQQWRIDINGGLCTKCTERKDQQKNAYAAEKANRKFAQCAMCKNSTLDRRSDSGYICSLNAAMCKPYAEAKLYEPRFPKAVKVAK